MWEGAPEGGNLMLFARDRRIGELRPLAMATERECRDGAAAILASRVPSLLDGSTTEKLPNIANMLILPMLVEMPL
jgi:hypothetical protein